MSRGKKRGNDMTALFDESESPQAWMAQSAKRLRETQEDLLGNSVRTDDTIEQIKDREIDLILEKATVTNRLNREEAKNPKNEELIADYKKQLDAKTEEQFKLAHLLEKNEKIYTSSREPLFTTDSDEMRLLQTDINGLKERLSVELRYPIPNQIVVVALNTEINAKTTQLNNSSSPIMRLTELQVQLDNLEFNYETEKAKVAPNVAALAALNTNMNLIIAQIKSLRASIDLTPKGKHKYVTQTDIDYEYVEKLRKMIANMKKLQQNANEMLGATHEKQKEFENQNFSLNEIDDDNNDNNHNNNNNNIGGKIPNLPSEEFTGNRFEDPESASGKLVSYALWESDNHSLESARECCCRHLTIFEAKIEEYEAELKKIQNSLDIERLSCGDLRINQVRLSLALAENNLRDTFSNLRAVRNQVQSDKYVADYNQLQLLKPLIDDRIYQQLIGELHEIADAKRTKIDGAAFTKAIADQQNAYLAALPATKQTAIETNASNLARFENVARKEETKLLRLQNELKKLQTLLKNGEIKLKIHAQFSPEQSVAFSKKIRDNNVSVEKLKLDRKFITQSIERNDEQIARYASRPSPQPDRLTLSLQDTNATLEKKRSALTVAINDFEKINEDLQSQVYNYDYTNIMQASSSHPFVQTELSNSVISLKKAIADVNAKIKDATQRVKDAQDYVAYLRKEDRVLNGVNVNPNDINWFQNV